MTDAALRPVIGSRPDRRRRPPVVNHFRRRNWFGGQSVTPAPDPVRKRKAGHVWASQNSHAQDEFGGQTQAGGTKDRSRHGLGQEPPRSSRAGHRTKWAMRISGSVQQGGAALDLIGTSRVGASAGYLVPSALLFPHAVGRPLERMQQTKNSHDPCAWLTDRAASSVLLEPNQHDGAPVRRLPSAPARPAPSR